MLCCSELFRRAAERAFPAGTSAGAAVRLPVVRRDLPLSRPGDVDVTTTADGDADADADVGLDVHVLVLVGDGSEHGGGRGGSNGLDSVPGESADAASAARDPRRQQVVPS